MRSRTLRRSQTCGLPVDLVTLPGQRTAWRADVLAARLGRPYLTGADVEVLAPALLRDKRTARAAQRPAGPAGTRKRRVVAPFRTLTCMRRETAQAWRSTARAFVNPRGARVVPLPALGFALRYIDGSGRPARVVRVCVD